MEAARPAGDRDVERILELARELRAELQTYRGGELWARTQEPFDRHAIVLRDLVHASDARVLVGVIDDATVGYAVARVRVLPDGTHLGAIDEVYVEPAAREVGVGETMVNALVAWCTGQGCVGVDAGALPGHRAAKNFFEEQGFVARSLTMHRPIPPRAAP